VRTVAHGLTDFDKLRDPTVHWPFEVDPLEGACPMCAGRRVVLEQIDDDRHPVEAPCDHCMRWCGQCAKRVLKAGHACPGA
jgi:hypothetical protein